MKIRLLTLAFCLVSGLVHADLTIVQKVEGMGQNAENTSRFKGGKTRVDTSPGTSLIMDLKSGETISLNHPQKTYFKISGAIAQTTAGDAKPAPGERPEARAPLAATGKKETISGYEAEEYACTIAGVRLSLWLTKALPDYQAVLAEMGAQLKEGPMAAAMQNYGVAMDQLPGFPVRTVLEPQPGQMVTRTVVSLNTDPVPESVFQIPGDYKEISTTTLTPPAATNGVPTP